MKIISTDARVWWIARSEEIRAENGIYLPDALKKIQECFQFVTVPTGAATDGGHKFLEGRLVVGGRQIVIREMVAYSDGFSVLVYGSSEGADAVLPVLLRIGAELGMREPITPPRIIHESLIVFEIDKRIDGLISGYEKISKVIQEEMNVGENFGLGNINFVHDQNTEKPLISKGFRIERRTDAKFTDNRFFSFANTTTASHLRILSAVESTL
jgi:hypothetical protein